MDSSLIGKSIYYLRKKNKITQKKLSENICTQAQISKIEKGEVVPLSTTLYEIARKLGVDINYFFEEGSSPRSDYIKDVKSVVRKAIRERDYHTVEEIVKAEDNNPLFQEGENKQFLLWHQGIVHFHLYQDGATALELLHEALVVHSREDRTLYTMTEIEILNSIGIIHYETGNSKRSVDIFKEALQHLTKLSLPQTHLVKARIYFGLTNSLTALEEFKPCISYCEEGIQLCLENESLYLLGEFFYQSGNAYFELQYKEKGLQHLENSKFIFAIEKKHHYVSYVQERINHFIH
ncbi:helix-turn-helix domain-containing protein [Thalassorhabdus alkalitolerans]|uniref:Helix-turn-helix domain-containing protein n=1 Tax=Thalassorhabdus alkalitolerans TaxID=2282697 RepID=A0ABW0YHZ0_9BACI